MAASAMVGAGCSFILFSGVKESMNLYAKPFTMTRSVMPDGIVLGKGVESPRPKSPALSPSGHVNSIEVIEQSLEPELLTNNSNLTVSALAETLTEQFWTSNNWGLALLQKISFNSATPLINAKIVNVAAAAPVKSEYIVYKWVFFGSVIYAIIFGIIDLIKWFK